MPVPFFFFSFFCQHYLGLRNCKSVLLILKISQYSQSRWSVQLFPRYPCKNWYKNWCLHFYKTYITKFGKEVHLQDLIQMRLIKEVLVTSLRQDHVTNKNISTTRVPMVTKLGRMVTYLEGLQPIKSDDPLITCLRRSLNKLKPLYLHYLSV